MQRDNDRDRAIEHVLRQSLARGLSTGASPDGRTCVDGETLAAWTEGQLRGAEADAVERHLSDCVRCQQLLATFARTSPSPVAEVPLWRRWRLQWLVPIATAATVAAIWVAMPQEERDAYLGAPGPARIADQESSRREPPAQVASPADTTQRQDRDTSRARENQANAPDRKAVSPTVAPAAPAAKREEFERRLDDAKGSVDLQKTAAAPATTAEADTRARDNAALRAQQAESPPAAAREEAPARSPQAVPPSVSEPRARSAQSEVRGLSARQFVASGEIVSPNPANRWRITGDRQVERTTNGGAQWEAVTLPSSGPLTAGASPAPSICWIVGRSGAISLTTDGSRFVRISFPEPIDLISVTATDDQHATVTAVDGRTFSTADRGTTWSATPR